MPSIESPLSEDHPRGWWVMAGVALSNFTLFGLTYSWGLYQQAYLAGPYQSQSYFSLSLIGSITMSITFGGGLIVGPTVRRIGCRWPLLLGSILTTLAPLVTSFASELWHLYLTQGVLLGLGATLIFFSTSHLPAQWFKKRQGIASGLSLAGSSLGSILYMIITRIMIDQLGTAWSLRITSAAALILLSLSWFLIRERVGPSPHPSSLWSSLLDWRLFRKPTIALLFLMSLIYTTAYMIPFFFLPAYAVFIGLTPSQGTLITMAYILANGIGRVLLGWIADRPKASVSATMLISSSLAGVVSLCIWPFAHLPPLPLLLIVFCILHGVLQSAFVTLLPLMAAAQVPEEDIPSAIGLVLGGQLPGDLVGPAIFGALLDSTSPNLSYFPAQMFAGSMTLAGAFLLIPIRILSSCSKKKSQYTLDEMDVEK
ncbi:major facilitator superfamily domain-containing protein [Piptocephalis cylindrospora]|uniref:Major facilitator superfamily domain-containing protein n=1 Tax=Piptocephalis cylindrospora TaxID=1907219 RepID=A0A4P9Y9A7_9FUNG|nr:major facilitator superfamily domain-containing protein [Piptocephalis cylindrospora]|eukprot:RKP14590.1 major facilitator superfamily domain-containing protein [Piptocephalis cylindrospora]